MKTSHKARAATRGTALVFCLNLVGCANAPAIPEALEHAPPDVVSWPDLYRLVPAHAQALFFVDYRTLGDGHAARDFLAAGEPAAQRRRQQGFAESEDVENALQVSLDFPDADHIESSDNLSLYRLRPEADPKWLTGSEIATAGDLGPFRGRAMLGNRQRAMGRLSHSRVVLGGEIGVRQVINCADGIADNVTRAPWLGEARRAMQTLWPKAQPLAMEAWVNVNHTIGAALAKQWPDLARLRWFAVRAGGQNDDGLHLLVVARAPGFDEANAVAGWLATQVRQAASLPALSNLGLDGALTALQVQSQQANVILSLHLDAHTWADLEQRIREIADFIQRQQNQASH